MTEKPTNKPTVSLLLPRSDTDDLSPDLEICRLQMTFDLPRTANLTPSADVATNTSNVEKNTFVEMCLTNKNRSEICNHGNLFLKLQGVT